MTTTPQSPADSLPDWFERFPEPRTIPGGWDLSDLMAAARDWLAEETTYSERVRSNRQASVQLLSEQSRENGRGAGSDELA